MSQPKTIKNLPSDIEINLSDKVRAGIGLIAMKDASGNKIYNKNLDWSEVKNRINNYYLPWHNALKNAVNNLSRKFKKVLIPEINSGQLIKVIRSEYLVDAKGLNQVYGKPISASDIYNTVKEMIG